MCDSRPGGYEGRKEKHMASYFFTFGSDERFPFGRDDYVEVVAENAHEACELFRSHHPNRPGSNLLNCSFIYSDEKFNEFRDQFYPGRAPIEVIRRETR
jgi:hypothetical protein